MSRYYYKKRYKKIGNKKIQYYGEATILPDTLFAIRDDRYKEGIKIRKFKNFTQGELKSIFGGFYQPIKKKKYSKSNIVTRVLGIIV